MVQWLRDELSLELGYIICPLAIETYVACDEKCEECEYYIDFVKYYGGKKNKE